MKKRILGLLIAAMLLVSLISTAAFADTVADVPYLDENGVGQTADCTPLTGRMGTLESGWYVVNGNQTFPLRIEVKGNVSIILADGCTLTAKEGIHVPAGTSLTVYAQSTGSAGSLFANSFNPDNEIAAIGGNRTEASGNITINGGDIHANVVYDAFGISTGAAIGGGHDGNGSVTINGGSVSALAGYGAGIGGGAGYGAWGIGTIGFVTINGGTVNATSKEGGAIGTGKYGDERRGEIVITGGTVDAVSGAEAFVTGADGFVKIVPPAEKIYKVSSENGELSTSPYIKETLIQKDCSGCKELHLSLSPIYSVEYILNMPDELSHTFDLPKTVGTATLSLNGGEGIYVSGLACPVQKTMLSGEKPATIIGGTGESFYAYDGNGTVMVDFVGWTDDAGNTYHIGDKPELTADTTFYAAWSRNDGMAIAQEEQNEPDDDSATGSALSEGRLAIVVGVTAFAVGFLAAMFIFRKKKSASANGAEK